MRPEIVSLAAALMACAAPRPAAAGADASCRSGPYSLELIDEGGRVLPTYQQRGRTYVLGTLGERYLLRVRNLSGTRAEVVASVDGRDVIDGRPAAWEKRGYLVEPWGELTIDGYRLGDTSVAAFRFSSVPRSYAARKGDARDVGVIGIAVFPERAPIPLPNQVPDRDASPAPDRAPGERGRSSARDQAPAAPEASGEGLAAAPPSRPGKALGEMRRSERPGLGTEFGEEHHSAVRRVSFERARSRPDSVLTLRYDDRGGLLALGIDVDGRRGDDAWLRAKADPFRGSGYAEPPPGWRSR